eukprot:UN31798
MEKFGSLTMIRPHWKRKEKREIFCTVGGNPFAYRCPTDVCQPFPDANSWTQNRTCKNPSSDSEDDGESSEDGAQGDSWNKITREECSSECENKDKSGCCRWKYRRTKDGIEEGDCKFYEGFEMANKNSEKYWARPIQP